jgi:iron complex outermembrane recepter protein
MNALNKLAVLVSLSLLSNAHTYAQTAPTAPTSPTAPKKAADEKAENVETMIVTAQKRDEDVQKVPIAVSVVDAAYIAKSGASSLKDIVSSLPSVQFTQSQSQVQSSVTIRGVGSSGGVAGLEPSVGLYVDGVYLDRTSMGIGDFNDIERIEVLRGPQGTLFGKNNPAGLINFITKRPTFKPSAEGEISSGNYGLTKIAATMSTPVVDGKFAVRLSVFDRKRDGTMFNTFNDTKTNDAHASGVRIRALWLPTDNLDITFTAERGFDRQDCCVAEFGPVGAGQRAISAALGKPFPTTVDPNDRRVSFDGSFDNSGYINGFSTESNWVVSGYTLTGLLSYRTYKQSGGIDGDFSQLDFLRRIFGNRDHTQKSAELRIASPVEQPFRYVAGLYYFSKFQAERGGLITGADTPAIFRTVGGALGALSANYNVSRQSATRSDIDNVSYAAFGQATYEITKQFDISAGLRYTYDKKSISTGQTTTEPVPILAAPFSATGEDNDGKFSGMLNALYQWDKDTMTYIALTRGYKSFGFNDGNVNTAIGQKRFFDAELSTSVEGGLKKQWIDGKVTSNFTVFNTVFTGYQASSFAPGNTFLLQNAGKLTTRGLEVELGAKISRMTNVSFAYTFLDAKFNDFKTGPGIPGGATTQDLSGKELSNAPRHSFSLIGQQRWPIPDTNLTAFVWVEGMRKSAYFTSQNLDPTTIQPAYSMANARVGIEGKQWSLELWGRNLTDETVLYTAAQPPSLITAGSRIRFIADPRTYGITAKLKF